MYNQKMEKEIREAIETGERALCSLHLAQNELNGARSWGIVDLLGGGFVTDMIKHSKLSKAYSHLRVAREDLEAFQRELRDVTIYTELGLEIGNFLTFADFFFDGLVADYMVQSKIADARAQVREAIIQVEAALRELKHIPY